MLERNSVRGILTDNILPFWLRLVDLENGGFYGGADAVGKIDREAIKGGILNSRILWTMSAAYQQTGNPAYRAAADRAREFLQQAFLDSGYGGLYWAVDCRGKNPNARKQIYNLAFGIYALSEHYLATRDESSLDLALDLFAAIETHAFDPVYGGYIEAFERDWSPITDYRLSDKDLNSPKSMNTCLHVMEAYTALVAASGDNRVRVALDKLVRVILKHIIDENRFRLFFDEEWRSLTEEVSWGHDIEGSWLLCAAAEAVGDAELIAEVRAIALTIADRVLAVAIDSENGGLISGTNHAGELLTKKEWWPQAEAVIGFYNAYQLSGEERYRDAAEKIWRYITEHFVDYENGEWHNELFSDNTPDPTLPKAGFWKCPYHNARACLELMQRLGEND